MKKTILLSLMLAGMMSVSTSAQTSQKDSLQMEQLQEVVVKGVRAQQNAPFAVTNIKGTQLKEFSKSGKELPFLFSQTGRAGMERERTGHRNHLYAHPWCRRLAHQRDARRCAPQLTGRPVCVLGQYELIRFSAGLCTDTTRRWLVNQRRRCFRRHGSPLVGHTSADT